MNLLRQLLLLMQFWHKDNARRNIKANFLIESSLIFIHIQLLLIELKYLFVEEENILYGVRLTNRLEVEIEVSDALSIDNTVSCLIGFTIFDIPLLNSLFVLIKKL